MKKPVISLCILLQSFSVLAQAPFVFKSFDLNPGTSFSNPVFFTTSGSKLFFVAKTDNEGTELWVTDGTSPGTKMVKDINPGAGSSIGNDQLMAYNGKVYFGANDGTNGKQLWVSDGTSAGTYMLKSIAPMHTTPANISAVLNGKLYFAATDGTTGNELWETDGSTAGTVLAADISAGPGNSHPAHFCVYNNSLYFQAKNDLYKFDNSTTGASVAAAICPIPTSGASAYPIHMTVYNGKIIFSANNCVNGEELWSSDGTASGTTMLKDVMTGSGGGCKVSKPYLCNNKAYFVADNGTGAELWITDGTTAGTTQIQDIYPGGAGAAPSAMVAMGTRLFFAADDGTSGRELWVTDGTTAGTRMVKDILPGSAGSQYIRTVVYKNYLYFTAQQASGDFRLYRTDGTTAGTQMITPAGSANSNPATVGEFFVFNGSLYFGAQFNPAIGQELWMLTDTTGTTPPPNGITTPHIDTDIALYPNPAHHNFTIKTTTAFKAGSITLTDVTGRVVKTEKLYNNEQTISLQGIAPGMYIADIWLDDKRSTQKLIIE